MRAAGRPATDDELAMGQAVVERLLRDRSVPRRTRLFYGAFYASLPADDLDMERLAWFATRLEERRVA